MIPVNCASCLGWAHSGGTAVGHCHPHAKPAAPIDGQPAWAYPIKAGTDGCRHHMPHHDEALALKRQAVVRGRLQGEAA